MRKVTSKKPRRAIKKEPVLAIVKPLTFRVQEALLAAAKESNFPLSLLDPDGFEIDKKAVNTLNIGMTTKETPAQRRRMGFANMKEVVPAEDVTNPNEDRPTFDPEAVLHIDPGGDTWTLDVLDAKDVAKYAGVAVAVREMFGVNVTVVPITQKIG